MRRVQVLFYSACLAIGATLVPAAAQESSDRVRERDERQRAVDDQRRALAEQRRAAARVRADVKRAQDEVRDRRVDIFSGGTFLGIGVAEVDSERAKALNLKEERGVEVKSVDAESPAAKAGMKSGDVVLEYNGQRVEGTAQFMRFVRETPPGRQVRLTIWRGGATQMVTATLEKRKSTVMAFGPNEFNFTMPELPRMPEMPDLPRPFMSIRSARMGIETETLNGQLAEYFGVKEGVLVRSVTKGSSAEKAGLKAGDVITKVDGETITSPRELSSTVRSSRSKKSLAVGIYRDRKPMTVNVTLEEATTIGLTAPPDPPDPPEPGFAPLAPRAPAAPLMNSFLE